MVIAFKMDQLNLIRLYKLNIYIYFNKDKLNLNSLMEWIENFKETKTHELSDASFEHDTQASSGATTGDWFVIL